MDRLSDLKKIDTREVVRDLINWMDGADAGSRSPGSVVRRGLLSRAHLYFEEVSRRHGIPESDFMTPPDAAVEAVLREHDA